MECVEFTVWHVIPFENVIDVVVHEREEREGDRESDEKLYKFRYEYLLLRRYTAI